MNSNRAERAPFADNALAAGGHGGAAWERRAALLVYAVGLFVYRQSLMDDTFIHLQYARNLRAAGQIAFNAGEPSLGLTSPLWVLLLAACNAGEMVARLLSVGCGAFAVLVFGALSRRLLQRRSWAIAATVAWAGSLWLVRHAANGMETTLAVLLVLVAVELRARGGRTVRRDVLFGLALAGAALVRPEALLLGGVYLLFDLTSRWGRDRIAAWLPAWILPIALWVAFAHARTGEWIPATGAAKSGGFGFAPLVWLRVLMREARILGAGHAVEMIGALVALGLGLRLDGRATFGRIRRHPLVPYAVFTVLLMAAYALDDVQVQPRYLLLVTPCVVLAGFAAWAEVAGGGRRAAALVAAASLLLGAAIGARSVYPATRDFALGLESVLKPMARDVAGRELPEACLATPDIGVLGYYSGARILDLGGLTDKRVAALINQAGYDTMLDQALFLDLGRVDYVVDRSPERERYRDRMTRGRRWRVLLTGPVRGLGISRPQTYWYTLYALEPETALGGAAPPRLDAAGFAHVLAAPGYNHSRCP